MASTDVTFAGLQQKLPRLLAQLNSGALTHVRVMDRVQTTGSAPNSVVESLTPVGVLLSYANYLAADTTGAADAVHLPMNALQRQDAVGRIAHLLRAAQTTGIATIANTAVAATGSIACVATASLVNGDRFTIGDGIAAVQTFAYDTAVIDPHALPERLIGTLAADAGTSVESTLYSNVSAGLVPSFSANLSPFTSDAVATTPS